MLLMSRIRLESYKYVIKFLVLQIHPILFLFVYSLLFMWKEVATVQQATIGGVN
jgi:hypothetical protein